VMQCSRCQHRNEDGARFCEECAAPLALACATCGRQLSATAKFCPGCAHPTELARQAKTGPRSIVPERYIPPHLAERILNSRAALEGERKQVTVLFADLKGSMELLADRDPEEARTILDPVLEHMMEAVHRYEGTVNQVMGDGIMALFGAPLAHEDHAVRACNAALRMQESVKRYAEDVFRTAGVPVQIRVGLNSGEVVVRAIGSDLRMDYTAVGQTTHLAARLQAAEFVYEARLFPELEYTFKHALTHEVAYAGLLQDRRRALHARILEAMEHLHGDRLGEHVERLAHHALQAEAREKAVHYLRQAGLKAAAQSALQDARGRFEQALALLDTMPESRSTLEQAFETRLELRPTLTLLGEVRLDRELLREAESLAERLNDDGRRGRVYGFMAFNHTFLGELDEAVMAGTRALTIARRLGDLRLRIQAASALGHAHFNRGENELVIELLLANLAAMPPAWVDEHVGGARLTSVSDRTFLVWSLAAIGRFGDAARHAAEAIEIADRTQYAASVGWAYYAAGSLHSQKGEWAKARPFIEHTLATFRTANVGLNLPAAVGLSALVLARLGETSEALARLREAETLLARQVTRGYVGPSGRYYQSLGRAALLLGRVDEARSRGERALESSFSPADSGSAVPARLHRDAPRQVRCRQRRDPLPPGAGPRRAARPAPARRLLPPRPRHAIRTRRQARGGT
jgi:class 3 adenylate cyclase